MRDYVHKLDALRNNKDINERLPKEEVYIISRNTD